MDDRQRSAVLAYSRELGAADVGDEIAGEVAAALEPPNGDTDDELLLTTQRIAARYVDTGLEGDWRQLLESVREARASRAFRGALAGLPAPPPSQRPLLEDLPPPVLAESPAPEPQPPEPPPSPPEPLPVPPAASEEPAHRGLVVFPAAGPDAEYDASPEAVASLPALAPLTPSPSGAAAPRQRRRPRAGVAALGGLVRQYRVFLSTLAAGAVIVVIVALATGPGSSASPASSLPPPATVSVQPPPARSAPRHTRRHAHRRRRHHSFARTSSSSSSSTSPSTTAVATTTAPVAPPTTTSHTSSSATVVATQQHSSLPPQSAPTQTVGTTGRTTTTP